MGRLPEIDESKLSSEQRRIYDGIIRGAWPYARAVRGLVAQRRAL